MTASSKRSTRKRNVPVPEELKQDVWYHGTSSDAAAKGILAKGLKPGHQRAWAYGLEPARGAVYLVQGAPALFRGPPLRPTAAWRFQRAWTKKETNEVAVEGTTPEELRDYFRGELLDGRTLRQVKAEKIL